MNRRVRIYQRSGRLREMLSLILAKYDIRCHFCGERLSPSDLPVRRTDGLTIHHLNGHRGDNSPENLVLAHRRCHKAFHLRTERG